MTEQAIAMTEKKPFMLSVLDENGSPRPPFWFMRQAGRYLPEYRDIRKQAGSFLNLCFNPVMAAEVTLQPLRRFDMDAAILFSDILVIPHALGQELSFETGEGPRLGTLELLTIEKNIPCFLKTLNPVLETVSTVRNNLDPDKTLIGFAGSPWTVACYMIEGQGSRQGFQKTKKFIAEKPEIFSRLMDCLVQSTIEYLSAQISAGADIVQLFDSWAGLCGERMSFEKNIIAPTRCIVDEIKKRHPGVPVIGFPRQAGDHYKTYAKMTGVDVLGLDQDVSLVQAMELSDSIAVQGNMNPEALLHGGAALKQEAAKILKAMSGKPFVFNLGHGVIKETPPENVALLSETIKAWRE